MKILITSEYYYPERFLITEIAERLVKEGHEITVLTGRPNYGMPAGAVPKEYRSQEHREEVREGVRIIRCKTAGRGTNKVTLFHSYLSYMRRATKKAKHLPNDFDVVLCNQLTPIFQLHPAIRYCEKNNKKLVCYCLDLAPESGSGSIGKLPLVGTLYAKYAKWAYSKCDAIAVTSRSFISYLHSVNGVPVESMTYLPQHASPELLDMDLSHERTATAEFLFAGNIGNGPRPATIVRAAEILRDEGHTDFHVTLIGNGSAKDKLIRLVKEKHLETVVLFRDGVPMSEMANVYKEADVLLVTLRRGQITVPGKLQAYMATGKPIIGAMDGSGAEMITEVGCGTCAPAEDHAQLAELMKDYILHPQRYVGMGEIGRRYFEENFSLDTYIEGLTALLEKVQRES